MEYLHLEEISAHRQRIQIALDKLLQTKSIVGKPHAKQWRFFYAIAHRLLSPDLPSEFDNLSSVQAAQFKFEIEDKLRYFYVRAGSSIDYVFTIFHKSELQRYGIESPDKYPCISGYCLLVRDMAGDYEKSADEYNLPLYLERVVTESIDAEFHAYMSLPEINMDKLKNWFITDSPAMKEIMNVLTRHKQRGWIITNPWNPSTRRLLNIKVKEIKNDAAFVNTLEYWYLRWYDQAEDKYVHPYRVTNHQMYILNREQGVWKVFENLRSLPRSSNIMQRSRRDKKCSP